MKLPGISREQEDKTINRISSLPGQEETTAGKRLLHTLLSLLVAGLCLYAVFRLTGYGIPCFFRTLTGYLCPGCGMTHAVTAAIEGDFKGALYYNLLSLTLLPVLDVWLAYRCAMCLRQGSGEFLDNFKVWELILLFILAAAAIAYGILRNVPGSFFYNPAFPSAGFSLRDLLTHLLPAGS